MPPGAYYIKVDGPAVEGGKIGFDVSNTRLQVGPTVGFPHNGATSETVVTNAVGYLGTNMSFETGDVRAGLRRLTTWTSTPTTDPRVRRDATRPA